MKKIIKKNQVIITALAIMIAVAGYLNFSSKELPLSSQETVTLDSTADGSTTDQMEATTASAAASNDAKNAESTTEAVDTMDISDADAAALKGAKGNQDDAEVSAPVQDKVDGQDTSNIGEAVLTNAGAADFVTKAKLNREQTRAKSKEMLMNIIDNSSLSEKQKEDAINQMLVMTKNMELESQTEQLLGAKGFLNSVVSVGEDTVDVILNQAELNDVQKAQVEDIVNRKTQMGVDKIVISTMKTEK